MTGGRYLGEERDGLFSSDNLGLFCCDVGVDEESVLNLVYRFLYLLVKEVLNDLRVGLSCA